MKLTHNGKRFEFHCTYEERVLPMYNGFHWDGRVWYTGQSAVAKHFAKYADQAAKAIFAHVQLEIDSSRAKDANYDIIAPKGLEYLPFQKAGIVYALQRFGVDLNKIPEEFNASWGICKKTK